MSETQQEYPLGSLGLRDEYPEVILPPSRTSYRHLHIPAEESGTEILCYIHTRKTYYRKDNTCLPDGHVNWCQTCLETAGELPE